MSDGPTDMHTELSTMSSIKNYLQLVAEMRTTQKNYFKTRMKSFLIKSKELEKQVDEETALRLQILKDYEPED